MSTKKRTLVKGGIVIVKHENSEETYYFDGVNLIDSTGKRFTPFKENEKKDWDKLWETDDSWRIATIDEGNAYVKELRKNGYDVNYTNYTVEKVADDSETEEDKKKVLAEIEISYDYVPCDDTPYNQTFKDTVEPSIEPAYNLLQDYKNEIVRLWKLVEELGTMADCSISGCDKMTDRKFGLIGEKALARFQNVKSDTYNLFFKGEKLTNNNSNSRIYDYGK